MGTPEENAGDIETIGDRIRLRAKELKVSAKLSQLDIAKKINKASSDISRWKKNDPPIPSEMIEKLATAMECEPAWLLTGAKSTRQERSSARNNETASADKDGLMTWKFNIVEAIYTGGNPDQKKRLNTLLGEIMNEMLTEEDSGEDNQ